MAAAELALRGLCQVTLLGNTNDVHALALQRQVDLSKVSIVDPTHSPHIQRCE